MSWQVLITNDHQQSFPRLFPALTRRVARHFGYQGACAVVSLLVTGDQVAQEYNDTYLGHDYPTDVVSLCYTTPGQLSGLMAGEREFQLGAVIINVDQALRQQTTSLVNEVARLYVHSLLHLLHYDHTTSDEERVMFALQEELIDGY